jgi:hypothetical protein
MSIDDTNRKKVRPDRSSCRREASSDHAGAGADEQANCQRTWRFANALPATADLIVSMSQLSRDACTDAACQPRPRAQRALGEGWRAVWDDFRNRLRRDNRSCR